MYDPEEQDRKIKLFYGSIIFGITIPVGIFIVVHFGYQIEYQIDHSSLFTGFFLWLFEWLFIFAGVGLPWITWKKLVEPYKDF